MKAAFLILCLLVSLCAGAVGSLLVSSSSPGLPPALGHDALAGGVEPRPLGASDQDTARLDRGHDPEVQARIDRLSTEIADLRSDLASLRQAASREPVADTRVASAELPAIALTSQNRDAIRTVLEEEEERKQAEREAERRQREEEWVLSRAKSLAEKLGLGAADEKHLADVMTTERLKRREIFEELRAIGGPDMRDQMRAAMGEIRDWKTTELETQFGPDLAKQISEEDGGGRGDWGGGRRSGGGGGNNGGNGGGGGGGGRRR